MSPFCRVSLGFGIVLAGTVLSIGTIHGQERPSKPSPGNPLTKLKSQLGQGDSRVDDAERQPELELSAQRGPRRVAEGNRYQFEVDITNSSATREARGWIKATISAGEWAIEGENPQHVTVPPGEKVTLSWGFTVKRLDNNRFRYGAEVVASETIAEAVTLHLQAGGAAAKEIADDPDFLAEVKRVADKFEIKVSDLLALMASESGFRPNAKNKNGTHVGLIQFSDDSAKSVGSTQDKLLNMSRAEQMKYVDKYLAGRKLPLGADAGQIYVAVFAPAYAGKPGSQTLYSRPSREYVLNRPLDKDNDGNISISELGARLQDKKKEWGILD